MPFTPYHLGPALLAGLLAFRWLDFPTFVVASVIVDVYAGLVFLGVLGGSMHGPLTTFVGGGVVALLLSGVMYPARPRLDRLLGRIRLPQPRSAAGIVVAALAGVWLHVVLDATLYADVHPLAPVADANPFLGLVPAPVVYGGCAAAAALGLGVYVAHLLGYVSLATGADRDGHGAP